jgi:hypothetical protein
MTKRAGDENVQPVGLSPVTAAVNLRRSAVVSCVLGVVAIVVCSIAGHPLMGILGCVGLALGAVNNYLLQRAVQQFGSDVTLGKSKFRRGVMGRLSAITLVSIGIALLVRPDGLGIFVGLAVFQVLMLVGAAVPVFRSLRPSS